MRLLWALGYFALGFLRRKSNHDLATFSCPAGDMTASESEYFTALHDTLVSGAVDESAQEHYVKTFDNELKCVAKSMLETHCGDLPPNKTRLEDWTRVCVVNEKADLLNAYDLMDKAEKQFFHRLKGELAESAIYRTYFRLASMKEAMCLGVKLIDDNCYGSLLGAPRLLDPDSMAKLKEEVAAA